MGKYFKYAIGEILLVVIGILIALQINNWNENKKEKVKEQKILKELLVDLEISKSDLEHDIELNKDLLTVTEDLKNHIHQKKPKHDTFQEEMFRTSFMTQFSPRTSGYENLKSEGISLITNDSLRKQISNLFEIVFPNIINLGKQYDQFDNSRLDLAPYFMKYFEINMNDIIELNIYDLKSNPPMVTNYEELLVDRMFFKTLQKTIYNRVNKMTSYLNTVERINNVNTLIEKELSKNSND